MSQAERAVSDTAPQLPPTARRGRTAASNAMARRHEVAEEVQLQRDARRSLGENLEEGARLVLVATTMADAFSNR